MTQTASLRRLARDRNGAAALEFALVAPLVFAAVLGTFESGRALYEANKLSAACAAGARTMSIVGAEEEEAITAAILAKYSPADAAKLEVAFSETTIAGATFKKMDVTFDHDFIVKFGPGLNGVTFSMTRYAPALS